MLAVSAQCEIMSDEAVVIGNLLKVRRQPIAQIEIEAFRAPEPLAVLVRGRRA